MLRQLALLALALLMVAPSTFADRRKYAWTYQYGTIAPDATELEFYQTTKLGDVHSWEYRLELEHGITPKMDLSIYQIFTQADGGAFKWDAFQVRGRYRLAEPGRFVLDPLLYLEYNRKIDLSLPNEAETKLILSRDFNKVNLSLDPVYEISWAPGEAEHEVGLDAGLAYELSYKLSIAVESSSRHELKDDEGEFSSYFGPALSFASGDLYYTVGYAWGLTDESTDARVRFLLGVGL